jgi:PDZ domain-containing secreted protein
MKKNMKKASTLLMNLALVFAVLVFFTAVPVVAKSPASKATVKQLKKGVSFTAGDLKYKVVTVSAKQKNVQVIGTAKKNVTKIVVPATVKVTSRKGKYK